VALARRGGAPLPSRVLVALERPVLCLGDGAARFDELLEQLGRVERDAVDQPGGSGRAAERLHPLCLVATARGAKLLGERVATGDEAVGGPAVELVQAIVGCNSAAHGLSRE
jgi:hypothetical protein